MVQAAPNKRLRGGGARPGCRRVRVAGAVDASGYFLAEAGDWTGRVHVSKAHSYFPTGSRVTVKGGKGATGVWIVERCDAAEFPMKYIVVSEEGGGDSVTVPAAAMALAGAP